MRSWIRLYAFTALTALTLGANAFAATPVTGFNAVVDTVGQSAAGTMGAPKAPLTEAEKQRARELAKSLGASIKQIRVTMKPEFTAAREKRDAILTAETFDLDAFLEADAAIGQLAERRQTQIRDETIRLAKGSSRIERRALLRQMTGKGKKRYSPGQTAAQPAVPGQPPLALQSAPVTTPNPTIETVNEPAYYSEIRAALRDIRARERADFQQFRTAIRARAEAFTAPLFDEAAFIRADEKMTALGRERAETRRKAIGELAAKYNKEQREALAKFLRGPAPRVFR